MYRNNVCPLRGESDAICSDVAMCSSIFAELNVFFQFIVTIKNNYLYTDLFVNTIRIINLKFYRFGFMRKLAWWVYLMNYFPIRLVKTHDLPADKSYIFATYPHGVFSYGSLLNFGTDASNFPTLFPGLRSFVISLSFHFMMPFSREIAIGLCKYNC